MKRIRIERPKARRAHPWLEILPLDPRDPDIVRVKTQPPERRVMGDARARR